MTVSEILKDLEANGSEQTKKIFKRHGAREPFFGVKVAHLKTIQKKIKKNYILSMALYTTGNSDAMYLAGLIADPEKMSKADLHLWVEGAYWYMISEYTVAPTAAASNYGLELALQWIDSPNEFIASSGWACLSSLVVFPTHHDISMDHLDALLNRVRDEIHKSQNRVRYTMNGFVIAVGSYVALLSNKALELAKVIGKVDVEMGGTACKVPFAQDYIVKSIQKGSLEKHKTRK